MSKFLKFNIVDSAALATQGTQLVNVDQIQSVVYAVATGVLSIVLEGAVGIQAAAGGAATDPNQLAVTYGARVITSTVTTNATGAVGIPTIANGRRGADKAVYAAMTANPGGVQSTVQLGFDEAATPLQMYFSDFNITTAIIA